MTFDPRSPGGSVSGTPRETLRLSSGRFAMIDDGPGFHLVPWAASIDGRRGNGAWVASLSAKIGGLGSLPRQLLFVRSNFAQQLAASPDLFDDVYAAAGGGKLFTKLAAKHVDDIGLWLIHAAIELIEDHFLGQRRISAHRQSLEELELLRGEMKPIAAHIGVFFIYVDDELAKA